ncbi:hypothetical protein Poli38472_010874 [Pythium oligandrum]|uniref:Uncharacterized protein n=1 Tax=Pythium oligandrum TaxID=41045 RepID=A0A8K1CFC3_PYTOL|nr:hypothetical protein Poli38472_010874 [Pythium oligandrum]|eukprot:TMW61811.1 hypothetical protein Poli38472_010874 [Pythium oligandrum]
MEDGVWLDNRMATLSILPADATIILTKGESTITINEILPIVLSAYLESEVAQTYGGRLPSKLLFVFNQIDLAEKSKLENIVDALMHELNANAKKVAEIRHDIHARNDDDMSNTNKTFRGANVFDDLNYAITDEENTDVRVLGTIKAQSYPPHDAPLPDYGQRLLQLREHIHRRVCESKKAWKAQLHRCVRAHQHDKLVNRVNECAHRLTAKYCAAFDVISMEIRKWSDMDTSNHDYNVENLVAQFCDALSIAVFNDVSNLDDEMQLILSEECFSKWATDQQNRWNRHKEDQATHWCKLIQDQVDNVFRYDAFVGQYKIQIRNEANTLFGNGRYRNFTEHQIAGKFEDMFGRILGFAYDEHPPMHIQVPAMVERVFHETKIWALSRQGKRPRSKRSLLGTVYQSTLGKFVFQEQPRLEMKLEQTILANVSRILETVNRYDDLTVLKCIQITKSTLLNAVDEGTMTVTDKFQEHVYLTVKKALCDQLRVIQFKWDQENGLPRSMQLLQNIVCDWLERNVRKSFIEELVGAIGLALKEKRWVSDPVVMQAMIDNSLVELIESKHEARAIALIDYPSGHIDDILSQLIRSKAHQCLFDKLTQFARCLIDCIRASAAKARHARKDRTVCFLSWLKSGLRDQLPTAAINCLLTSMPHANDGNINCDDQPPEVFDENDLDFVCKPMIDVVEQVTAEIGRQGHIDVTLDVLMFIRSRAHGASSGVMPRCGEPCPICKSPCTRELGHVATEDEKCHDTYHQPTGLTGWRDRDSRELSAGSCLANAQADTVSVDTFDGFFIGY